MDQVEEYVKRIMKVLVFIEENFNEDLTLEELAKVACYSPFHFSRIFQAVVGETVHRYVKRLRIEQAAQKLLHTEQSVTEIALDTNYETPSAFTKAFKQIMGASPKRYRTYYASLNAMTQKIKELSMIQPERIENNFPDLDVLFVRRYGNCNESPWKAWQAMIDFMYENQLEHSKVRYFGIVHDDSEITHEGKLRYDAAVLSPQGIEEKGEIGKQTLKGLKYAIFTHEGSLEGLEKTFNRIFFKWLPESDQSFDEARLVFFEYLNMEYFNTDQEKLITKVYIPLN